MSQLPDLVFYDRETLSRIDERETLPDSPKHAFARWLVAARRPRFGLGSALASSWTAEGRLERGRHLLRDAEAPGGHRDPVELWERCADAWRSLCSDYRFAGYAQQRARALGCTVEDADEVLGAVTAELLPMLHVRAIARSLHTEEPHRFLHVAWMVGAEPRRGPAVNAWWAVLAGELLSHIETPHLVVNDLPATIRGLSGLPAGVCRPVLERLTARLAAGLSAGVVSAADVCLMFRAVPDDIGYPHSLLRLALTCEKSRGLALEDPAAALKHLAVASCLDPRDEDIVAAIEAALAKPAQIAAAVPWDSPAADASDRARRWLDEFCESGAPLRYSRALDGSRIDRLCEGLRVDETDRDRMAPLVDLLDEGRYEEALTLVDTIASELGEGSSRRMEELVDDAATTGSLDRAIERLPASTDDWSARLAAVAKRSPPERASWAAWSLWAYSGESWKSKVGVVAGVAMIAHGMSTAVATSAERELIEQTHRGLEESVMEADAASVADAALEYARLCRQAPQHCPSFETWDDRYEYLGRVDRWGGAAALIHVRTLARDGRVADALTWLEAHESELGRERLNEAAEALAPAVLDEVMAARSMERDADARALAERWARMTASGGES